MDCKTLQDGWQDYLQGQVSTETCAAMELHLGDCQACQAMPFFDARLIALLQERFRHQKAPAALRARILAAIGEDAQPTTATAAVSVPGGAAAAGSARPSAGSWLGSLLGSQWAPRVAMAAVVLVVLLIPVRLLFRAPALATSAVERYERHIQATEMLHCCHPLALQPGDRLGEPSRGTIVPDLSADGLEFVLAGRCDDQGTEVTALVYRSQQNGLFSLYITDRALENFQAARSEEVGGFRQVRHQVHRSEVTIWESAGLVWFWIGPGAHSEYSTALADLRTL